MSALLVMSEAEYREYDKDAEQDYPFATNDLPVLPRETTGQGYYDHHDHECRARQVGEWSRSGDRGGPGDRQ